MLWQAAAELDLAVRSDELEAVTQTENASLADHVEGALRAFRGELFIAARHPATQRLFDGSTPEERDEVAEIFRLMVEEIPATTQMRYLDARGDEIVRVDRRDDQVVRVSDLALQNKADRYYFIDTMALEAGDLYVSPLDLNVENGVVEVPWVPTIRLATPVSDANGDPAGIVIVNFDAGPMLDAFDNASEDGQRRSMLLNRDGYWLAGLSTDQLFGNMFPERPSLAEQDPELWQELRQPGAGVFSRDGVVYAHETVAPQPREAVGAWVPHRLVSDSGLVVLTTLAVEHRIGPLAPGGAVIALVGATVLGLVAWIWSGTIVGRRQAVEAEEQARSQLIRSEKMASLGSLVAGIAHELNTPIGNAVTIGSTMADQIRICDEEVTSGKLRKSTIVQTMEQLKEGTEIMLRGLSRASDLIGQFKQIAVDQSGEQRRTFALDPYLQEVAASVQFTVKHRQAKLCVDVASGLTLDSFPGPLSQVVINLVTNAFTHGFPNDEPGTVTVGACAVRGKAVVTLTDTGRGIPQEVQHKIFDPFFTTRLGSGGAGLGLSIVHGIVTDVLGGTIRVDSAPGRATVFTITIPTKAPAERHDKKDPHHVG
ncbi:MAG: sensor histidine kinase [Rhodospirillaceae bacterium]|nr:sensor histidine kinase [Rhodospirillaceae bacterium]